MLATLRAREHGVSRLEGFSDDVFAFALTLLVVSLEVPRTYRDLEMASRGFVGFALTFAVLGWIWHEHKQLFTRFRLDGALATFLNMVLLFLVLLYIYPLKFLAQLLMRALGLVPGDGPTLAWWEAPRLMTLYSAGFVAIFLVFALLYRHALGRRGELELGPEGEFDARAGMRGHLISVAVGALSLLLTLLAIALRAPLLVPAAGFVYFLLGPLHAWNGVATNKRRRKLLAAA